MPITSCTMDSSCEAYEYNVTEEGTCHLLNRTPSTPRTLFLDGEIQIYVKGKLFPRIECTDGSSNAMNCLSGTVHTNEKHKRKRKISKNTGNNQNKRKKITNVAKNINKKIQE